MKRIVLVELGAFAIKACEIELGRRTRPPIWLAHRTLPEDAERTPAAVAGVLRQLLRDAGTRTKAARLVLTSPDLVVRGLHVPSTDPRELATTTGFAMAELLPLPLDELVVDYEIVADSQGVPGADANVVMAGAPKMVVAEAVHAARLAGLSVEWVDVGPLAAACTISALVGGRSLGYYLVVVGAETTTIEVVVGEVPQLVRSIPFGGEVITRSIAERLDLVHDVAEGLKRKVARPGEDGDEDVLVGEARRIVESSVAQIVAEVASSIDYFASQRGYANIDRVMLVGGSAAVDALGSELGEALGLKVDRPGPRRVLRLVEADGLIEESSSNWVELTGAVLRAYPGRRRTKLVNLLPAEERARHEIRRRVAVGALSLAVVAALLGLESSVKLRELAAARSRAQQVAAQAALLAAQVAKYRPYGAVAAGVAESTRMIDGVLSSSTPWPQVLAQVAGKMPADAWLTGLQVQAPTPGTSTGTTVSFSLEGCSQLAPAHWLEAMSKLEFLANLWVSSSTLEPVASGSATCGGASGAEAGTTTFSGTGTLEPSFGSYRATSYLAGIGVRPR